MASEFTINSQSIETKINQLLPSQAGSGAGVDFSASTMIIPIVDLTESAQGSQLREDLQTSFSHGSITQFNVTNTTSTLINNTGYWRVFGSLSSNIGAAAKQANFVINDGSTDKKVLEFKTISAISPNELNFVPFDFTIFLEAGDSFIGSTTTSGMSLLGCTRQIATITGELVNP